MNKSQSAASTQHSAASGEQPETSGEELPGLYVHVPFCKTKCPYCGFYSITDLSLMDRWVEAVTRETSLYKNRFSRFDSLYFGGGTPTLLKERHLGAILESLRSCFIFSPDAEVTIEANPDDVTDQGLKFLKSLGINRLSFGVQSFDDKELSFLKRRHTALQAEQALEGARSCGFMNVGIDLMYGLPGQTENRWRETLEHALTFEPAHLSCYQLTVEEGTQFGKMRDEGRLSWAGEDAEKRFFLLTSKFLRDRGFIHYEVSNFARDRDHISRHNSKYWHHAPYLGLGPAAHSFREGVRWWNFKSVSSYCERLAKGKRPVEGSEKLTEEQLRLERLLLGFRTARGVSLCDAIHANGSSLKLLTRLQRSRDLKIQDDRVIPSPKGFLVADRLPLLFSE
jgi:putative oxygen-independent coproporphyrinogen III oxidase